MSDTAVNLPAVIDPSFDDGSEHRAFDDIDHPRQRRYLQALSRTGSFIAAERLTGINRDNHYFWTERDSNEQRKQRYSAAVKRAIKLAGDSWEDEIAQRAFIGYEKAIVYKGKITGYTVEKSDFLAICRMNAERPDRYHRNPMADQSTAPVTINIVEYVDQRTINVNQNSPSTDQVSQVETAGVKVKEW